MRSDCNFVPGAADFTLPQSIPMAETSRWKSRRRIAQNFPRGHFRRPACSARRLPGEVFSGIANRKIQRPPGTPVHPVKSPAEEGEFPFLQQANIPFASEPCYDFCIICVAYGVCDISSTGETAQVNRHSGGSLTIA